MMNKPHIFLDIDGVLATTSQFFSKKRHEVYDCYSFDPKCVKVFNQIISVINPIIILSSDWRVDYDISDINNIFAYNKLNCTVHAYTKCLWGVKYRSVTELEECRADEIMCYVNKHKLTNFVAVDDLNLNQWLGQNFVQTPRANEGIKQVGIKEKIINKLTLSK